jgi:hypothetical protein
MIRDSIGISSAGEPVWIARAVVALVAVPHDRPHFFEPVDRRDDLLAELGCVSTISRSSGVSGPGFERIVSGMPILPMSWKSAPSSSRFSDTPFEAELLSDLEREVGDPARVRGRVLVVRLERVRKRLDRLEERALRACRSHRVRER